MRSKEVQTLDREECMRLMKGHPACVGRIALGGPRPTIFPVNYAIDEGNVVFRTGPGSKFHAAVESSFVAFEVDWVEPSLQLGWSVVVRGQARLLTHPADIDRVQRLPLLPWTNGDKAHFVSIESKLVSGRRLIN